MTFTGVGDIHWWCMYDAERGQCETKCWCPTNRYKLNVSGQTAHHRWIPRFKPNCLTCFVWTCMPHLSCIFFHSAGSSLLFFLLLQNPCGQTFGSHCPSINLGCSLCKRQRWKVWFSIHLFVPTCPAGSHGGDGPFPWVKADPITNSPDGYRETNGFSQQFTR